MTQPLQEQALNHKGFSVNKILSSEEIEDILIDLRPLPSSYYWSSVVGVMAYAGLQDREVIELLTEDVDLKAGFISVKSSEDPAKNRQIKISEELEIILKKHPRNKSKLFFPNIQANMKPWYESSFEKELNQRLPHHVHSVDLSNSFTEA